MKSLFSWLRSRRSARKFRLPMQLKFTREGKWFCWIALAVGFAAVNTGNNLLYLLLGLMLSLIIISGILCNISLNQLRVERHLPHRIFAKTPCLVTLSVTNQKRLFPSFSIELEDFIENRPRSKKCYFLKVGPQRTQQTAYRLTLERRGPYHFRELHISSKFPFSLFIKTRIVEMPADVLVFPHIQPVSIPQALTQQTLGMVSSARKGHGNDFFALRDMRPGDELKWIHWPSTARTGLFQVREFEDEHALQLELMLWHQSQEVLSPEQLDPAVDFAASLLFALHQRQQPLRFFTLEQQFTLQEMGHSLVHILTHLALLQHSSTSPVTQPFIPSRRAFLMIVPQHLSPPPGLPLRNILRAA